MMAILVSALLFFAGLVFGRMWFGFIVLPLIYGVPRATVSVLRGEVRMTAIIYYVFWAGLASVALIVVAVVITVISADMAIRLRDSQPLTVGQLVGVGYGILQMLSSHGREDLNADFLSAMANFRRGDN